MFTVVLFGMLSFAQNSGPDIRGQAAQSQALMLQNIDRPDSAPGVVVAAASHANPNYYFLWIRDSALTMQVVGKLYSLSTGSGGSGQQAYLKKLLLEYVDLTQKIQLAPNRSGGLGEPKFNVDGSDFLGDWGRPQNDGPAIRASSLIAFARTLVEEGENDYVHKILYPIIKTDLEFVSHHWGEPCFDLWEEVFGFHFYTLMVQRRALVEGAAMAAAMGDPGAAQYYREQLAAVTQTITKFWDPSRGYIVATLNGNSRKPSNLDSAVILGVLHGHTDDGFLNYSDPKILATAEKIRESFENIYAVNSNKNLGTAIGRYPEDTYNGYSVDSRGNPWFLSTLAYAELFARAAVETGNQKFLSTADSYFARVFFHRGAGGSLSEQFNRDSGFMQGAPNLTWSHASFITAAFARLGLRP